MHFLLQSKYGIPTVATKHNESILKLLYSVTSRTTFIPTSEVMLMIACRAMLITDVRKMAANLNVCDNK